ncbi:helix-turn-helix domain-containing protein [Actinospica sp. MGRD01-02]|uniref:Helix-turn-helix domain-containing protein n=1 Tax=Actinospica acidithermotolerans TaxID=2828514 RepID=A0A941EAE6_9ACTN|nr:helix-turn-helix transcriptional regulator [Actinospica acidithermotolerans]MBR7827567.1 helix-turn-helix domain-containing protein [Actinospica acidithermotolerans]
MDNLLGNQMREVRRASGLRFVDFVQTIGYSASYVRNVEGGSRAVTAELADAYDRVLATGGRFRDALASKESEPWDQAGNIAAIVQLLDRNDVELDRRSIVAAAGVALGGAAVRWVSALRAVRSAESGSTSRQVGKAVIDNVDQRLGLLRHLDDELGSGEHAVIARNELAFVVQLLKTGSYSQRSGERLYSLASEASRQAAWSSFDQGKHGAALAYFDGALRASANARDGVAGAYALSFFAVHCYSTGQARAAVDMIDTAQSALSGSATPRMSAMLAARSARAQSKAGERTACIRDLAAARVHLDRGPHQDDPAVLYWVTEAEIEMIAGSCALELGDSGEALRRFEAALAADYRGDDQYPRSAAIYLARAAEAHLAQHDLEAAVFRARQAVRCLESVDSARSSSTLAGLRTKLASHTASPVVGTFLEEYA